MGFCKTDSDLWTFFLFYTQRIAFWMLCIVGEVIFDKTYIDRENPDFMIRLPNSCLLKYPSWFKINLKFLLKIKFHLSIYLRTKIWAYLITGCTATDWFKSGNSIEKKLRKPYQWVELILFIQHQEIYINNFASFYGFQSLFSIELTNLNQSVVVQPVIRQVQIFSPARWKGEFLPPTKILSLYWASSDILRDNCLIVQSWNMDFLGQR